MYLLDTNAVIHFFKGQGRVAEQLAMRSPVEIGIPAVVLYELQVGVHKSKNPEKNQALIDRFVGTIDVIPFGYDEAKAAARIRADLESKGEVIGPVDILIAATASASNHILVTNNVKEFKRVHRLDVVDWL